MAGSRGKLPFIWSSLTQRKSERMLWVKGLPSASYLRASECPQLGKALDENCEAGSMRNLASREPVEGAVVPGEIRNTDIR